MRLRLWIFDGILVALVLLALSMAFNWRKTTVYIAYIAYIAELFDVGQVSEYLPQEITVYGPPIIRYRNISLFYACGYRIWRLSLASQERIREGGINYLSHLDFDVGGDPQRKTSEASGWYKGKFFAVKNAPMCGLGGNVSDYDGYSPGYDWLWARIRAGEEIYSLTSKGESGMVINVFPDSGYIMSQ